MNSWLKIVALRLRALFRRNQVESELDKEIAFHIDMLTQEKIEQGIDPTAARAQATKEFGHADFAKEQCRESWGVRIVSDFWRDVRFGIRQLMKSRGFTIVSLLTLAFGIGANTAMFSLFNTLLLRPVPFPNPDEIVRIYPTTSSGDRDEFSASDYLELETQASELGDLAAYTYNSVNLSAPGQPAEVVNELSVSTNFFQTLDMLPFLGRDFQEKQPLEASPNTLIISHSYWQNRFSAASDIIGHELRLDGETHEIVGVLPEKFYERRFLGQIKIFRPIEISVEDRENTRKRWINLVGRLAPDTSPDQANAFIANLGELRAAAEPEANRNTSWRVAPIADTFMNPTGRAIVGMLLALSGLVLIIACGNLANVLLARTILRSREFAMRAAVGASRFDLIRPLVVESLILAIFGGACALVISVWIGKWLTIVTAAGGGDGIVLPLDWRVLGFATGLSLIASLAFAIAPALFTTRIDINRTIGGNARGASISRGHYRLRNSLIVAQFTCALILLAGSGFFLSAGKAMFSRDYGWNADNVIIGNFRLPPERYPGSEAIDAFHSRVTERLQSLPGVTSVSLAHSLPYVGAGGSRRKFFVEGQEMPQPGEEPTARVIGTSPDHFKTTGTPLLSGRPFSRHDTDITPDVAIITQATARGLFGEESPIGKRIGRIADNAETENQEFFEIVGVVGDIDPIGLSVVIGPTNYQVYRPLAQSLRHNSHFAVKVEGAHPGPFVGTIQSVFTEIDPILPIRDLSTAVDRIRTVNSDISLISPILSAFAILGLALASLGIYGVIARSVAQRSGEFGIRMALGAKNSDIVLSVIKYGLRLSLTGTAIGLIGSYGLSNFLASTIPNMASNNALVLCSMTATLIVIAILASYLPARKATQISPGEALLAD